MNKEVAKFSLVLIIIIGFFLAFSLPLMLTGKSITDIGESFSILKEFILGKISPEKSVSQSPPTTSEFEGDLRLSEDQNKIIERLRAINPNNQWIVQLKDKPIIEYKKQIELGESKIVLTGRATSALNSYREDLENKQEIVKSKIRGEGLIVKDSFKNTFNGIVVEGGDINKIRSLEEVKQIYPDIKVEAFLDESVPLIGADQVWQLDANGNDCIVSGEECLTGKGISIAIIDTGVDYTHPDLGGCFGVGCKVVGGYDFHNNDNDPMDDHGHGTHVASIAAGKGVLNGVAPDAKVYAYKVLSDVGGGSLSNVILAIERAVDPNGDDDFSDAVDIISMSLGAPGNPDDPLSQASDNAVDLGVSVIAAVGNSGLEGYFSLSSPGVARKAIGVGASCKLFGDDTITTETVPVEAILISKLTGDFNQLRNPVVHYIKPTFSIVDSSSVENPNNMLTENPDYSVFTEFFNRCPDDFGLALYNDSCGGFLGFNDSWAIIDLTEDDTSYNLYSLEFLLSDLGLGCETCDSPPVLFVAYTKNLNGPLTEWIPKTNVMVNLDQTNTNRKIIFGSKYENSYGLCSSAIVTFSSQGPSSFGTVKPDVTAPGHIICAARYDSWDPIGSLPYSTCLDEEHVWLSGTSMAAPHVAGAVALIKQAHPTWTPQQIKNTLKGTALDYGLNPLIQGAGNINVLSSVQQNNPYPTSELTNDNLFEERVFDITGTADSSIFDHYDLEYGIGENPTSWNLITSSTNKVENGILGTFDLNSVQEKEFTFRLTVYDNLDRKTQSWLFVLKRDPSWKQGWPQTMETDSTYLWFSPTYADLNNDGNIEIIASSPGITGSKVYVWDINGNLLPGWPQEVNVGGGSTPAIGDVDDDLQLEIIYKSTTFIDFSGGKTTLYAFNHDGTSVSGWPKDLVYEILSLDSPVLEDIDNDGKDEIIVVSIFDGIRVFNGDGSEILGGWNSAKAMREVSVGDINNDGKKEIIAISFDSASPFLYAWKNNGQLLNGFPVILPETEFPENIVLGDVNNNGKKEIFFNALLSAGNCLMYAYDSDGNALSGWPFAFKCSNFVDPLLIDIDSNNDLEILLSRGIGISLYDHRRNFLESMHKKLDSKILVAQVNTQNKVEVFSGMGDLSEIIKIDVNPLSVAWTKKIFDYPILDHLSLRSHMQGIALGDVDNDGKLEIITTISSGNLVIGKQANIGTRVFVIDLDEEVGDILWSMYKHDQKHTGDFNLPGPLVCGDADGSGSVNIADVTYLIARIFGGGPAPIPPEAGDVNGDGKVNIADITYLISRIFAGGPAPICPSSGALAGGITTQYFYTQSEINAEQKKIDETGAGIDIASIASDAGAIIEDSVEEVIEPKTIESDDSTNVIREFKLF